VIRRVIRLIRDLASHRCRFDRFHEKVFLIGRFFVQSRLPVSCQAENPQSNETGNQINQSKKVSATYTAYADENFSNIIFLDAILHPLYLYIFIGPRTSMEFKLQFWFQLLATIGNKHCGTIYNHWDTYYRADCVTISTYTCSYRNRRVR
jgi:hypothetical protein